MVAQADRAFERSLKRVIRKRLDAGQDPGAVLAELKARLDPARAERIFTEASRTVAAATPPRPNTLFDSVLLATVMIWASVLFIQNVAVIAVAGEEMSIAQAALTKEIGPIIFFAAVKLGLLLAAASVTVFTKMKWRFLMFSVAILYVFPLGILIEGALMGRTLGPDPTLLVHVSAMISYVCAAALVFLWLRSQSEDRIPAESGS